MSTPLMVWMRQHDGVAHSRDLREHGYSPYEVRKAVDAGELERVRRSWLLTPHCSPDRRAAAAVSGRVTCVTAAARLKLWSGESSGVHVAVPPTSSRIARPGLVLHWSAGPVPVARFTVDDPVLNVLHHIAHCLAPSDAVIVWEAALRRTLVTLPQLRRTDWRSTAVDDVLRRVGLLSDSMLETTFLAIMRSCGVEVRQQVLIDGHRVDGLIGERLIMQLDGFEFHSTPKDRRRDLRQDARLALLGYTVLRFDYQQVMFDQEYVQQTILNAVAQGLHLARRR
ncbi:type IV toxin-antitoxin system AbiEi family antitoxin domain-containing protein [Microbacterium soli]